MNKVLNYVRAIAIVMVCALGVALLLLLVTLVVRWIKFR
jgi:hypothetical protein